MSSDSHGSNHFDHSLFSRVFCINFLLLLLLYINFDIWVPLIESFAERVPVFKRGVFPLNLNDMS